MPGVAGAGACLRCGGELASKRRAASPFRGPIRLHTRLPVVAALGVAAIALAAVLTWPDLRHTSEGPGRAATAPPPTAPLASPGPALSATHPPPGGQMVRLRNSEVQESCVGRSLPGDLETVGHPVSVIDANPLTSWHCDGDGARLRPAQSLTITFPRPLSLASVGVIGFDPYRPCRFVTRMALRIGGVSYLVRLPDSLYPRLRWFAVPGIRASRVILVVTATQVPPGWYGPNCDRTAIAQVGFAGRRGSP